MKLKTIVPPPPERDWPNMFTDLINALNNSGVGVWHEVSGIANAKDLRVKQINLLGTVRKGELLGKGYRVTTVAKKNENGDWSLFACKVKKGKRK